MADQKPSNDQNGTLGNEGKEAEFHASKSNKIIMFWACVSLFTLLNIWARDVCMIPEDKFLHSYRIMQESEIVHQSTYFWGEK